MDVKPNNGTYHEYTNRLQNFIRKIEVRLHDNDGHVPLLIAIRDGDIDICRYLLQIGADVNYCAFQKPQMHTSRYSLRDLKSTYFKNVNEEQLHLVKDNEVSIIMECIAYKREAILKLLFQFNVKLQDKHLLGSIITGSTNISRLLIQNGCDPTICLRGITHAHKVPSSWEDYQNFDNSLLKQYITPQVISLCIKKNYKFLKFIMSESKKAQACLLNYAEKRSSIHEWCLDCLIKDQKDDINNKVSQRYFNLVSKFNKFDIENLQKQTLNFKKLLAGLQELENIRK